MKTTLAAAFAALLMAAPAFAAEEYQSGPPLVLHDEVPARDTGSAQTPAFDGQPVLTSPHLLVVTGNASEGSIETVNSQTVPIGTYHATIGLLLAQH